MKNKYLIFRSLQSALVAFFVLDAEAVEDGSRLGLFVEPAVTYEIGATTVNYPPPLSNSSGEADGFGVGARIGFHFYESFFLGIDGRYSMPQFKDSSVNYNSRSVATNWGPVVGMQIPNIGLRVWGVLILGAGLDPDRSGSFDVDFNNSKGYRIGTGFRVSIVSLNLEYQQIGYDKTSLEQIGPFSSSASFGNVNLDNNSWIGSVSFPLEL